MKLTTQPKAMMTMNNQSLTHVYMQAYTTMKEIVVPPLFLFCLKI